MKNHSKMEIMEKLKKIVCKTVSFFFPSESVLCLAIGATIAVDWCGKLRCISKPHVGCNNPAVDGVSAKT